MGQSDSRRAGKARSANRARDRQQVRFEDGLRLSLPKLIRDGFLRRGERVVPRVLRWSYTYTGEEVAKLVLSGSLKGQGRGWLRPHAYWIDQCIELRTRPRQFGGSQFETPYGRAISQAQKIRMRIGGPEWVSLDEDFPPKPEDMRCATYDRIAHRCERYEAIADARLYGFAARLLAR